MWWDESWWRDYIDEGLKDLQAYIDYMEGEECPVS